jgi:hypothetical protein
MDLIRPPNTLKISNALLNHFKAALPHVPPILASTNVYHHIQSNIEC